MGQPKKRHGLSMTQRRSMAGYMFLLPFILGFLLFFLPPVIQSITYCFNKIIIVEGGFELQYVGLKNFITVFMDNTTAWDAIMADMSYLASNFFVVLIFSMFVAILLNSKFKGKALARVIFFLPVIISMGFVIEMNEQAILQGVSGMQEVVQPALSSASSDTDTIQNITVAKDLYKIMFAMSNNLPMGFVDFIVKSIDNIYSTVQRCGVQILIFLAALQAIPPSLYEASNMEGATGWENFWKITLPMVSPMILATSIYTFVDLTYSPTSAVMGQVAGKDPVLGACISWVYALIIFGLLIIAAAVAMKSVFYQE